jgi:hypothetical protein
MLRRPVLASGTSDIGNNQHAWMMLEDGACHRSTNFCNHEQAVQKTMSLKLEMPSHQGSGASLSPFLTTPSPKHLREVMQLALTATPEGPNARQRHAPAWLNHEGGMAGFRPSMRWARADPSGLRPKNPRYRADAEGIQRREEDPGLHARKLALALRIKLPYCGKNTSRSPHGPARGGWGRRHGPLLLAVSKDTAGWRGASCHCAIMGRLWLRGSEHVRDLPP